MLDMGDDRPGLQQTVQAIYDLATGGMPLEGCLDMIRRETGAVRAELWACPRSGRDPAAARLLAGSGRAARADDQRHEFDAGQDDGATRSRLVLWRSAGLALDACEAMTAEDLLRHLHRARMLTSRMGMGATEAGIYASVLDCLAVGAIFLDERGAILRRTGLAAEILGQRDGLRDFRGMVAATSGADDRRLQAAIRAVLDPEGPREAAPRSLVVARPEGGHGLGLIVQRLERSGAGAGDARAVILIRDPERGGEPERAMLRSLFDLTPAEAELARSLTAGFSLDEAAASLSISRNTARAHLRAIFSKSGITRQTELMRLMLNSAAMLGRITLPADGTSSLSARAA